MSKSIELNEGTKVSIPFIISDEDMVIYEKLSGDSNAIHVNETYAKDHGFRGRVVYGGLIVSAISKLIGMFLPGDGWIWHSLKIDFKKPLYIQDTAELQAIVVYANLDTGIIELNIKVLKKDGLVALGTVQSGRLR